MLDFQELLINICTPSQTSQNLPQDPHAASRSCSYLLRVLCNIVLYCVVQFC